MATANLHNDNRSCESGNLEKERMTNKILNPDSFCISENSDDNEADDIIILHMDIREPLRSLKTLLERKIGADLNKFTFWLQEAQMLEPHKNLVDQCVKGEGLVQINVQIQTISKRINIVDVLKPTDAALAALSSNGTQKPVKLENESLTESISFVENSNDSEPENKELKSDNYFLAEEKQKPFLNWVLDSKFKKEQTRLKIPDDPNIWNVPQVKHWFQWAVRQFNLTEIILNDWNITGNELCSLTHEEFRLKLPRDPGNIFWTHLQLLKKCKFVSVVHKIPEFENLIEKEPKLMRKNASIINGRNYSVFYAGSESSPPHGGAINGGAVIGSGINGQVQLWQFLLEILTDREHRGIIQWVGTDGEFKLIDPEKVARLWGEKKKKPAMNYEKLSRALRYYYDGDMISKVSGKRFAYKFDCDLKCLIGYNAEELSKLVTESYIVDEAVLLDNDPLEIDNEE